MSAADFAAQIDSAVLELRALAESRMLTTCLIQYEVGTESDPDTDADVPVYVTAFESKCRIKTLGGLAVRTAEVGGRTSASTTRMLSIPVSSPDPWADPRSQHGVTALITAVHATDDPTLLGARLSLAGPAPGSQTTARRLEITEIVS